MAAKSRTAKFYAKSASARRVKARYQAEFDKRPSQVKKRVALNRYNRQQTKLGRNRVGDKRDASHKGNKIVGYSHQSKNRGDRNNTAGDRRARGKFGRRR